MTGAQRPSLATQLPEPGRFWVRYAPKVWEGPADRPWLDLAAGRLKGSVGVAGAAGTVAPSPAPYSSWSAVPPLDDVLYLPPVPRHLAAWRDRLAAEQLAAGTPLLVQLLAGDDLDLPVTAGAPVAVAIDLTAALLSRDLDRLSAVAGWAIAVWPLLPGLTDDPAVCEKGCRKLAAAGVRRVQALAPTLTPADRRRLAAGASDRVFDALFHAAAAEWPGGGSKRKPELAGAMGWGPERDFARLAHRHGLESFLPRPLPPGRGRGAGNRSCAAALCLGAELWLRLGRAVEPAQALYRAARWVDGAPYDVEALAREGNLGVVVALDEMSRRIIREQVESGESVAVRELMAEYQGAPAGGETGTRRISDAELASR